MPPSGSWYLLCHPSSCCGQPRRRVQCTELAFSSPDPHPPGRGTSSDAQLPVLPSVSSLGFLYFLSDSAIYFSDFCLKTKNKNGWVGERHRDRKGGKRGGRMEGRFTPHLPCAGPMLRLLESKLHNPPGDGVVRPISQMSTLRFKETRKLALITPSRGLEPGSQPRRSSGRRHWIRNSTHLTLLKGIPATSSLFSRVMPPLCSHPFVPPCMNS